MPTQTNTPRTKLIVGAFCGVTLLLTGWLLGGQARAHTEGSVTAPTPPPGRAYVPAANAGRMLVVQAESPRTDKPGFLPASDFHPRDPEEWQGMKVDLTQQPPCMESAHCGQAMACNLATNLCGPCEADNDCSKDEACVLDHCVKSVKVTCRGRLDCADGALCVLSGLSPGPRGNTDMASQCLEGTRGGSEAPANVEGPAVHPEDLIQTHGIVYGAKLLESLRESSEP